MQYAIVSDQSASSLQNRVGDLIRLGWVPQGGIAVSMQENGRQMYTQAITRETGELGLHDR